MDSGFKIDEKLYRAVYPPEVMDMFWKRDGSISSAAFADAKGLSVDRGYYRPDSEVIQDMSRRFNGRIISLYVKNCIDIGAVIKYMPSRSNIFHSEIHGSSTNPLLSKSQRRFLAGKAVLVQSN
ncbi:MAG: hypothetical protein K6E63_10390 [Lachnospiraceae bacterium]|nr:hypothetical protein [Lachnospiraceae bacterium]